MTRAIAKFILQIHQINIFIYNDIFIQYNLYNHANSWEKNIKFKVVSQKFRPPPPK